MAQVPRENRQISRRTVLRLGGGLAVSLGLGSTLLAACGDDESDEAGGTSTTGGRASSTTRPAAELASVNYPALNTTGGISNVHFDLIVARGLAAKHGLELNVERLPLAEAEAGLVLGRFDAGYTAPLTLVRTFHEGRRVVGYDPFTFVHNAVLVPVDSEIETFADIRGKKFALLPAVTAAYTSLQVIAAEHGMDLARDIQVLTGDLGFIFAQLEQGAVDAGIAPWPGAARFIESGRFREIANISELWAELRGRPLPGLMWSSPADFHDDNPETIEKIIAMHREASEIIVGDPAGIFEEFSEVLALETPAQIDLAAERTAQLYATNWTDEDTAELKYFVDRAAELEIIEPLDDAAFDEVFQLQV